MTLIKLPVPAGRCPGRAWLDVTNLKSMLSRPRSTDANWAAILAQPSELPVTWPPVPGGPARWAAQCPVALNLMKEILSHHDVSSRSSFLSRMTATNVLPVRRKHCGTAALFVNLHQYIIISTGNYLQLFKTLPSICNYL